TALSPPADTQQARVKAAANAVLPLVEKTRSLGCRFGLYNHGGWGGAPENLVAVCQCLREHHQGDHVGIVYNFHHGHEHMVDFRSQLQIMKPYLLCLNINGMDDAVTVAAGTNKILPVGSGRHELSMLQTVKSSGYDGPVGILDHRSNLDAEKSLRQNLDGLKKLVAGGL
ncbi:MAG: sugar phosphate isomerase/epimerase, partial [Fuerstiella sp.]|nr:sugar phosphate isomerase/epimerase [Fuerstiella sp.]